MLGGFYVDESIPLTELVTNAINLGTAPSTPTDFALTFSLSPGAPENTTMELLLWLDENGNGLFDETPLYMMKPKPGCQVFGTSTYVLLGFINGSWCVYKDGSPVKLSDAATAGALITSYSNL
jgi:hypothetical protein